MPVDHSHNIIEIKNLSFAYGRELILENISLNIHQGDYIGLIGPNGAGKTTLFKLILGLLRPQSGSIRLFGQDIATFKDWQKIGYVPQRQLNLENNFPATVKEVVAMGRYRKKRLPADSSTADKAAVKTALEQVEMLEHQDRLIGDLSGGQQQRVFIARALVNSPEVIFLDEATRGVDTKTQNELYRLLQKLNKELDLTLLLISHDIERLTQEVMHIACVDKSLTCHMSPEEYIKESQSASISGQNFKFLTHHHNH